MFLSIELGTIYVSVCLSSPLEFLHTQLDSLELDVLTILHNRIEVVELLLD
uniref:Uncharacterized protein n=1 Tax=Solanum lycopersicum TaxID=4081 RepID=A0A3Q7G375_SOLLC